METRRDDVLSTVVNNCSDGIYFVDRNRRIVYWNRSAEQITGYSADAVVGTLCQDNLLGHIDEKGTSLCMDGCPLHETLRDGQERKAQVYLRHREGHRTPVSIRIVPMFENGAIVGAIEYFADETAKIGLLKDLEALQALAMLDTVTGLPNRRAVEAFLANKAEEHRVLRVPFGMTLLDLDDFKTVNDRYGRATGDLVLREVGKSCGGICRKADVFGHWGGEEFAAVFVGVDEKTLIEVAEKLRMIVENTVLRTADGDIHVTVSVGATMYREGDTLASFVNRADALLYRVKNKGKNCVCVE